MVRRSSSHNNPPATSRLQRISELPIDQQVQHYDKFNFDSMDYTETQQLSSNLAKLQPCLFRNMMMMRLMDRQGTLEKARNKGSLKGGNKGRDKGREEKRWFEGVWKEIQRCSLYGVLQGVMVVMAVGLVVGQVGVEMLGGLWEGQEEYVRGWSLAKFGSICGELFRIPKGIFST